MPFNSLGFLAFFGVVFLLWYILPSKIRPALMLLASFVFYAIYSIKASIILLAYILLVYIAGLLIEKKPKKGVLAVAVIAGIAPLFVFKYLNFSISILDDILNALNIIQGRHGITLILPLGISYFSFKSLSYIIDVYRGKVKAERNIIYLGAFVSFFPEMLVGPIDRADNLLAQLKEKKSADWKSIQLGAVIAAGGFFEKMVVADRMGVIVDTVYGNLYQYEGLVVFIAAALYSLQIYFDFAGCTNMVIGMGKMLGFDLPINFTQPYLAISVEDFWRRWHISLTGWLREYIYFPLGGNRKGTVRKYVNVMIVFLISGLWHGAGLNFIVWGGLNGAFQVVGTILKKSKQKCYSFINVKEDSVILAWWKRIGTFILMTICWAFFRADNLAHAGLIFKQMLKNFNPWILFDGTLYELGLSEKNLHLLLILLIIMVIYDLFCEKGVKPAEWFVERHFITKTVGFYLIVFAVIILGMYGSSTDWSNFIYVQF